MTFTSQYQHPLSSNSSHIAPYPIPTKKEDILLQYHIPKNIKLLQDCVYPLPLSLDEAAQLAEMYSHAVNRFMERPASNCWKTHMRTKIQSATYVQRAKFSICSRVDGSFPGNAKGLLVIHSVEFLYSSGSSILPFPLPQDSMRHLIFGYGSVHLYSGAAGKSTSEHISGRLLTVSITKNH